MDDSTQHLVSHNIKFEAYMHILVVVKHWKSLLAFDWWYFKELKKK